MPEPEPDTALRNYYRLRAPHYEAIYRKPERQADLRLVHARLAHAFAGRRVLDLACGTGFFTADFAASAREVVGIDANAAVLDIARAKNLPHCRFIDGDAHALDPNLGLFDAAFLGFWWSHLRRDECAAFVAQLARHLTPGARVIILDNHFRPPSSTPLAFTDADGNTYQDRRLADGSLHRVLKNFPQRRELLAAWAGVAGSTHWLSLDYYWWFECERR